MAHSVNTALTRKLAVRQRDDQGDKPRSVLRALRLAFARAAGERMQLPLTVIGARQSDCHQDNLAETIGDDWLLLLFRDNRGICAAACLDPGAVSAIVQTQTIGEVLPVTPSARVFTDTDAAMASPLIEDALLRSVDLVEAPRDKACLTGYEFVSRLADVRTLCLAMIEDAYRVFNLTVELAGGVRQGQVAVLLPHQLPGSDAGDEVSQPVGPSLDQASGVLRAKLNSVICRVSLPLASLSELKVGDVFPLTGSRLDRTEILTIDNTRAAVGRLGQCGGMRAVRLNEHTSLPVLADPNAREFVENKIGTTQPDPLVQVDETLDITPDETRVPVPMDEEMSLSNPERMAAEISQLAGLNGSDEDLDHLT